MPSKTCTSQTFATVLFTEKFGNTVSTVLLLSKQSHISSSFLKE